MSHFIPIKGKLHHFYPLMYCIYKFGGELLYVKQVGETLVATEGAPCNLMNRLQLC